MKTLLAGAAAAAAGGLLTGGLLKPDLQATDGPRGPQVVAESPDRAPQFEDRAILSDGGGYAPDWVWGVDRIRAAAPAQPAIPNPQPAPETQVAATPVAEAPPDPAVYDEPPREPPAFPLLEGGAADPDAEDPHA